MKAILFEVDHVLMDPTSGHEAVDRAITTELGRRHGRDGEALFERLSALAKSRGSLGLEVLTEFLESESLPTEEAEWLKQVARTVPWPGTFLEDARALLDSLPAELRVGIVTHGDPGVQRKKIEGLGAATRFEPIVFAGDFGPGWQQPSPLPFQIALRCLRLPANEVLYVGHCARDGIGPWRLGMPVVHVVRDSNSPSGGPPTAIPIVSLTEIAAGGFLDRLDLSPSFA